MFNLIITIISIALVIGLAAATVFYGSDAFTHGAAKADAAKTVSQGQQIKAAVDMYIAEKGIAPPDIATLTSGGAYLKSVPGESVTTWNFANDYAVTAITDEAACRNINIQLGHGDVAPSCTDTSMLNQSGCCVE